MAELARYENAYPDIVRNARLNIDAAQQVRHKATRQKKDDDELLRLRSMRRFVDRNGKNTIFAEFKECKDGLIRIQGIDGKETWI